MISSRSRQVLVLSLLLLGVGSWAPPRDSEARDEARNVLLVVVDTLRSDRLSSYGYDLPTTPRLDALAREGALFLNHYTQASHTRSAIPSLFYSRYFARALYPDSVQVPLESALDAFQRLDAGAVALPRALADAGMRTALFSAHHWLDADSEIARQFDEVYDPRSIGTVGGAPTPRVERVVDRGIEWLERNGGDRFFLDLHLMDMHQPRAYDEDAEAMLRPDASRRQERWSFRDGGLRSPDEEQLAWLNATYDGSLRRVDRELGRLFDYLEERGLLDETLIVVTADHGENLGEPGRPIGHGGALYESVGRVPLIVRYPAGVTPRRVESPTSAVDVMPTILGLADAWPGPDRSMDGIDLSLPGAAEERGLVVSRQMVRSGDLKLLLEPPGEAHSGTALEPRPVALYDLRDDPRERIDLLEARSEDAAALLARWVETMASPYQRFVRSRADAMPPASFALDARSFEIEPLGGPVDGWSLETSGWEIHGGSATPRLRSTESASPIAISFPLPSGLYRVSMMGRGSFGVVRRNEGCSEGWGQRRTSFEGRGSRGLGRLRTCGGRLELVLTPRGAVDLQLIGFQPLGNEGSRPSARARERDRDLRALGYVN